jgi:hypothetical protein
MAVCIQVILPEQDWDLCRRQTAVEGLSLSAWLREAARERLEKSDAGSAIHSVEDLRVFFKACDEREPGQESDWDEHLEVIRQALRTGAFET